MGNIQYHFFFLAGMIYIALPLQGCVDVEWGKEDAMQNMRMGRKWEWGEGC